MARSEKQKLKLYYLYKLLEERSDERHPVSMDTILQTLSAEGITAERKSIYRDVAALAEVGVDVEYVKARQNGGYYLASRRFELPELKLLVDAVQASRFMTVKKSRELIGKLETCASVHDARQLNRQVYVVGRPKAENEAIYYSIDEIHRAIQENEGISFQYLEWSASGSLTAKHGGAFYDVIPYALVWYNENYYLVAAHPKEGIIKHFRLDKVKRAQVKKLAEFPEFYVLSEKERIVALRAEAEKKKKFDVAEYSGSVFGMFSGVKEKVTLACRDEGAGICFDHFGKGISVRPDRERGEVLCTVNVEVSPQFFGWLDGLGGKVRLVSPESVVTQHKEHLRKLLAQYGE